MASNWLVSWTKDLFSFYKPDVPCINKQLNIGCCGFTNILSESRDVHRIGILSDIRLIWKPATPDIRCGRIQNIRFGRIQNIRFGRIRDIRVFWNFIHFETSARSVLPPILDPPLPKTACFWRKISLAVGTKKCLLLHSKNSVLAFSSLIGVMILN